MNNVRLASTVIAAIVGVVLYASPAAAQTQVSCGTAISDFLSEPLSVGLYVGGTRVTASGSFGFTSFTMADGYYVLADPVGTPDAAAQRTFFAGKTSADDAYTGYFHEVLTDSDTGDVDRWQFWVYDTGAFWLRLWAGGSWTLLQGVTCYDGPQGQILVTGHIGYDFWTFVIRHSILG